jgi:hypothetical protein
MIGPRRLFLPAVLAAVSVVASGCGNDDTAGDADPVAVAQADAAPGSDGPFAIDEDGVLTVEADGLPTPLVSAGELTEGGPAPDGIPPIDEPKFVTAADVSFIEDREPVIAVTVGEETRAYPIQILIWHEIVNDTIDGVPVAVTYCPLCNSAFVWDRRVDGKVHDFGTSGKVWNSSLVMYDRQTRSLWAHFTGEAIAGQRTGVQLESVPAAIVGWDEFREGHPEALVLSRDTGTRRSYGQNPYPGYDDVDTPPFLFEGEADGRLAAKERVVGIESGGDAVAVLRSDVAEQGAVTVEMDGRRLAVLWSPGVTSALDTGSLVEGREVGAVNVVELPDGVEIERSDAPGVFTLSDGRSIDLLGVAVGGVEGLASVTHVDTFWFAWAAFQPDTVLQ